jgi:arylsulfatase A
MKRILCSFFLLALSAACKLAEEASPPNVVIIYADDLGYGDLGCYGHPNIATPKIDRLAAEGIRFTSFYVAASVCSPSRAALLTGRYPIRNSPYNFGPESKDGLPLEEVTLANVLKEKGYSTHAIGKWHLGHQAEYLPTSRGFDTFYGLPYSNDMILPWCPWLTEQDRLFLYENDNPTLEIGYDQKTLTTDYTHRAIDLIEQNKNQPFFLYFAHSMPHLPISTSPAFEGNSEGGLYGDVIQTIDWSVGKVLEALEKNNLRENTLVIFSSDNGPWNDLPERMLQKGVAPWHSGSTGLLRGSKATTYEGGFRVPAIVSWPGKIKKATVNRAPFNTMDLFVTISSLTQATIPQDRVIDGRDISAVLTGQKKQWDEETPFFYCSGKKLQAVRKGEYKLRINQQEGVQLFDLKNDPGESFNLADAAPQIVEELMLHMTVFSQNTEALFELPPNR